MNGNITEAQERTKTYDDLSTRLIGLWGCERSFGPEVHGELTLVQDGSQFRH